LIRTQYTAAERFYLRRTIPYPRRTFPQKSAPCIKIISLCPQEEDAKSVLFFLTAGITGFEQQIAQAICCQPAGLFCRILSPLLTERLKNAILNNQGLRIPEPMENSFTAYF
jgi:hypothetical protein